MIEFILSICYFMLFSLLISKLKIFKDDTIPRYWYICLFGLKVICSLILTAIYTNYYTDRNTADIFKYYDDSKIMFDAIKSNPIDYVKMLLGLDNDVNYFTEKYYSNMLHWVRPYSSDIFSDSHIIIRFNAFVRLFSFGCFNVHNIFINFISLIGLTFVYNAFKSFLTSNKKALFYVIAIIPSVIFWGSGLLKEGIILFAFGLLLNSFFKLTHLFKPIYLLYILIGLILIIYTKFYLLVALFIPVIGYYLNHKFNMKIWLGYSVSLLLFLITVFSLSIINEDWSIVFQITNKQQAFSRFIASVSTNSGFVIPELTNGMSIIKNIPNALINTFVRPYPNECNSVFILISLLENYMIIFLILIGLLFRKKLAKQFINLLLFNLIFVSTLYILIGLTTPVFGAIVRYKLPALPLLLISILIIIDIEKLKAKNSFLNKIL